MIRKKIRTWIPLGEVAKCYALHPDSCRWMEDQTLIMAAVMQDKGEVVHANDEKIDAVLAKTASRK